jgi:hypothetical protein
MHIYAWAGMLIHDSVNAAVFPQKPRQKSGKGNQTAESVHKFKMRIEISPENISALVTRPGGRWWFGRRAAQSGCPDPRTTRVIGDSHGLEVVTSRHVGGSTEKAGAR